MVDNERLRLTCLDEAENGVNDELDANSSGSDWIRTSICMVVLREGGLTGDERWILWRKWREAGT